MNTEIPELYSVYDGRTARPAAVSSFSSRGCRQTRSILILSQTHFALRSSLLLVCVLSSLSY